VRAILLILGAAISLGAAEVSFVVRNFSLPVFDSAGHLIRRLKADSGTGLDSPRLDNGRVEFFRPGSDQPTGVLTFAQALYASRAERISGDGTVKLVAPMATISGRGYECQLETGLLELRSEVTVFNERFRMNGEHAKVDFDPKQSDLVREATVTGNVTVEPLATASAAFDRAQTESARFSAAEQKIFLKSPVTLWKKGEKGLWEKPGSEFLEIDLNEKPAVAPQKP